MQNTSLLKNEIDYMYKYFKIIDIKSNKVIASGRCISDKIEYRNMDVPFLPLISFDNKFFFRFNTSTKYKVDIVDDKLPFLLNIPDTYKICLWKYADKNLTADVYRDYGIDELDKEVEYLVKQLNKIPNISTSSSCCGHNRIPLWVLINFSDNTNLKLFEGMLKREFKDEFTFELDKECNLITIYKLKTNCIGKKAYKLANDLGNCIDKYINIF